MRSQPARPVTKAVIPAAGLGTRFLPATKATPKEMLPVVDKPAIQYVVEESVRAGLDDVLIITGRNKNALEDHFDHQWELEQALEAKGDTFRLERVRESAAMKVHFVRQGQPKGLGHAVHVAKEHVGDNAFAVLLGDDLIDARDHLLEEMLRVREEKGGSVVALIAVSPGTAPLYASVAVEAQHGDVVRVTNLIEKPTPSEVLSGFAAIGRYILDPSVFGVLEQTPPGRGGEIQLTDALQTLAASSEPGGGVHGVVFRGRRYDTGDRLEYLKAVVRLSLDHDELGRDFGDWLREFAAKLGRETGARQGA